MNDTDEQIKSLEIRPLREAFPKEAYHFTKWLGANIKALSHRLGMELTVVQTEKSAGDFSADILCEDAGGHPVIIENQLEPTDHKHLGQLITYLVNLEAHTAIWVASEPRPEHEKVIHWLNESTPSNISFNLVKVEAIRIGNSPYAPLFTVMAGPDAIAKEIGEKKKEWADRHYKCQDFWKGLLARSKVKTRLFSNISPGGKSFLSASAGKSGFGYNYYIGTQGAAVDFYIDFGPTAGSQKNKDTFDIFYTQKDEIEAEIGVPLDWLRNESKQSSRIVRRFEGVGLNNPDSWPTLQEDMIEMMIRFDKVLRPRMEKLSLS
jgi:hypothetical protein